MKKNLAKIIPYALTACAAFIAGCGGGGESPTTVSPPQRGFLTGPATASVAFSAAEFNASLAASPASAPLLQVLGNAVCGVDVRRIEYVTIGGAGESTTATAAIMVPTGTAANCTGARPIVLYAHGTTTDRGFNMASFSPSNPGTGEATLVAATYAAQGFIVVAPNYAGYDTSPLPYHPYLNATQQAADMVDALAAARTALPGIPLARTDSGRLFISGYSQGGYVAMATHRAMQAAGQTVTASAPLSNPGAISMLTDFSFSGLPALGGTIFTPLLSTSWQRQFGNVYANINDIYEAQFSATIETLFPSTMSLTALATSGRFPATQALYPANATPGLAVPALAPFGFYGPNNLIRASYLTSSAADIAANRCAGNAFPPTAASLSSSTPLACTPASGFRRAAVANDLRNWAPTRPMLICGGRNDPTVNFASSQAMAGFFASRGVPASLVTLLDLESPSTGANDPFAAARAGFAQTVAATAAGPNGAVNVVTSYHGGLVPPFCNAAARGFFQGVLASGA